MIQRLRWYRHYARARLRAAIDRAPVPDELLFVVPETARGWILDGICRDLQRQYPAPSRVHYHTQGAPLPRASGYFFPHYFEAMAAMARDPAVWRGKRFVLYTHPSDELIPAGEAEIVWALDHLTRLLPMNSRLAETLIARGVHRDRVTPLIGAADPELFRPHRRSGEGVIGISTAYYPRKNPELMAAVIRALPGRRFILIGKDWDQWPGFAALRQAPNLEYLTLSYRDYPAQYARMDCFLSTSTLEGGPIPLIESMMCNLVPVVSDTGFARDIVRHGENGYLFPVDAGVEQVVTLIEQALTCETDIAATVGHLSWAEMARTLHRMASAG